MNPKGFTLLEVLIAIAISSIIGIALFSTYMAIQQTIANVEGTSIKLQEARNTLSMLSKELSSAYFNSSDERTYFVVKDRDIYGKPVSVLKFTAFSDRGLMSYEYEVKEGPPEKDNTLRRRLILIKRQEPAFRKEGSLSGDVTQPMEAELLEDIEGFLVEVKGREDALRTWDTSLNGRLPERIRIKIILNINKRRLNLSETVIPRLQ